MRYIRPIVMAALLASTASACSYTETSPPRYQAYRSDAYYSNGYYTATPRYTASNGYYTTATPSYAASGGYYQNGNYYPPTTAYANPNPYSTSDNYYASRSDYYRNYQGIHGGPERN